MTNLAIKNLTKSFGGVLAVNSLSIRFKPGTISGVIGPNGSGKTTLINLLSGLTQIDDGVVIFGHSEVKKIRPWQISSFGVTRTFQDIRLFEQMTVLDNLLVVLHKNGVLASFSARHDARRKELATKLLKQVGLWEKRNQLAGSLSYGQRKLLELARAMATKAELYLFDEPFAGLFPEMIKIITECIKELRRQGKTVILIEHNMELISSLSDQVFVLDEGKLLAAGSPKQVLAKQEVINAYIGR